MPVTYPRQWPEGIRFAPSRFTLNDPVVAVPDGGARMNYTRTNTPAWQLDMQTMPLKEFEVGIIHAWLLSLRQGLGAALVSQTALCYPIAHTGANSRLPAQDKGTIAGIDGSDVTISGVDADLTLSPGDMVGFRNSALYGLGKVIQSVQGDTTTDRVVTIEPFLRNYIGVGSEVTFAQPKLLMRLIPQSVNIPNGSRPVVTFSLIEAKQ